MTPTTVRTTHLGTHRELRSGSTKSIFHGTWPLTMPPLHRWDGVGDSDDSDGSSIGKFNYKLQPKVSCSSNS